MSPHRVLVVCTANICRSPMAERLLAEHVVRHAPDAPLYISSAGTHARPGIPAAREMQRVATSWGLELDYHRSRRVGADLARAQDLLVTMERAHRVAIERLAPGVAERTFTLTELAELISVEPARAGTDVATQVARWHAMRLDTPPEAPDVRDPYGRSATKYEATAGVLARLVEQVGPDLVRLVTTSS